MKPNHDDFSAAILAAMTEWVERGRLDRHAPCIGLTAAGEVEYASALIPGTRVLWSLEEGLGDWTPEPGDDLQALAAGAAQNILADWREDEDEEDGEEDSPRGMRITTDHAASSYGLPVILDEDGQVMDYPAGVRAIRDYLGLSTAELAAECGVSRRTVEGWEQGRPVAATALNVMASMLAKA